MSILSLVENIQTETHFDPRHLSWMSIYATGSFTPPVMSPCGTSTWVRAERGCLLVAFVQESLSGKPLQFPFPLFPFKDYTWSIEILRPGDVWYVIVGVSPIVLIDSRTQHLPSWRCLYYVRTH